MPKIKSTSRDSQTYHSKALADVTEGLCNAHSDLAAYEQQFDTVATLLTPLTRPYSFSFSFSIYDHDEALVMSKGNLAVVDRLNIPEQPKLTDCGVFIQQERMVSWAHCVTIDGAPFIFTITIDSALSQTFDSKAVLALCNIGINFLKQSIDVQLLQNKLHQEINERVAVSSFIGDGLLVLDCFGFLKYINDVGKRILCIEDSSLTFRELLGFEPIISDVFSLQRGYVNRDVSITVNGTPLNLTDTAIPILDGQNKISSVVNIFRANDTQVILPSHIKSCIPLVTLASMKGRSAAIKNIKQFVHTASNSTEHILISGKSGTGKKYTAQIIHNKSKFSAGKFLTIKCDKLASSEFEHLIITSSSTSTETGSWRFHDQLVDSAEHGTILFDQVDALPISVQKKLLSALKHYETRCHMQLSEPPRLVRFIASTSDELQTIIREQLLHPGLHSFFSNQFVSLPTLAKRGTDPAILADFFYSETQPNDQIDPKIAKLLNSIAWPGNITQLKQVVQQFALLPKEQQNASTISMLCEAARAIDNASASFTPHNFDELSKYEAERQAIYLALQAMNFNITRAANVLGISRPTLYARIKKYKF
jgi:transcriptional regulator with PAS, ATPase and Fis domain